MIQWKNRLEAKVFGLRTMDEYIIARTCWDQGLSVHKTQRVIEDRRAGKSQ